MGFGGHQLRLKCAQVHHQSAAGTFTRVPGRCLRWSRTPSGPWWSPAFVFFLKIRTYNAPPSKFYVWSHVSHTHIYKLTSKFGELAGVRCHSAVTCPWFWNASSADQTRGGWWECLVWGWYGKSCHRHAPQLAKWRQCGGIRRLSCFLDFGVSRFASHPSCQ